MAGLVLANPASALAATVGGASTNSSGPTATASGQTNRPLSASTCNQAVCIAVTGSGTYVNDWTTTTTASQATCTHANYLANNVVIATSPEYCGGSHTTYHSTWPSPGYFANGTVLCNTWTGLPGRACVRISG